MKLVVLTAAWLTCLSLGVAWAQPDSKIVLPPVFSDGMVLQRDLPIPFWGTGAPNQKVSVALDGKVTEATADAAGKWMVRLPAMAAGGPYDVELDRGQPDALTVHNVLVGDVWVASGQSNMDFRLGAASTAKDAIASANDTQLRMFTVQKSSTDEPQSSAAGTWQEAKSPAVSTFSAVAFFFGRELRRELKVPIGILHSSYGGSTAPAWVRREVLSQDPKLQPLLPSWEKQQAAFPAAKADYDAKFAVWQLEADKAKAQGQPVPAGRPSDPAAIIPLSRPGGLYNAMIAPLIPYGIKGVIWYQGESNAGNPTLYRTLFPALIADWRGQWGENNFPFLFVQLPNYLALQQAPVEEVSWAGMREVQEMTLSVPGTGMATTIDLGDAATIHPTNKEEVGKRLAAVALNQVYGLAREASGPTLESWAVEGNQIRLRFQHARGLKARGETLKGFAIVGADKKWVWADAHVDGETVLVSSPDVAVPAAVRYDWANNPIGNLYNGADLPASSFRTDRN